MDIEAKALEVGANEFLGIYAFTAEELKAFCHAIVAECVDIVKPTEHHEAFPQSYLGEFEGVDLLWDRVASLRELVE